MKQCDDCHGDRFNIHVGTTVEAIIGSHDRLACQVCHIPAIARKISTKVEWYWSDAGQNISPIPIDPETGRPTYDKKKGTFVWANDVRLRQVGEIPPQRERSVHDAAAVAGPVGDYTD